MARYSFAVESSAALADNTVFANIVPAAAIQFRLRRVTLGVRVSTGATPTSMQVQVQAIRTSARGTQTTNTAGLPLDPNSPTSGITGVDSAWSVAPTLVANPLGRYNFNTLSGVDLPWEGYEELFSGVGTATGIALRHNSGAALPANHILVGTVEWEE